MTFSQKLDDLMNKKNIKNLRQLASELEIPYTTLWDYYSSPIRLEKANLTYIKKIAQRLNCTIDYLVYDEITDFNQTKDLGSKVKWFNNGETKEVNNDILGQYQSLFDKDDRLTEDQKKFFMNFLEERHKEIDAKLDKD